MRLKEFAWFVTGLAAGGFIGGLVSFQYWYLVAVRAI